MESPNTNPNPLPASTPDREMTFVRFVRWAPLAMAIPVVLGIGILFFLRELRRPEAAPLPILGELPAFRLLDQGGKPFTDGDLKGSIWITDFIFTRCATACPRLTATLARIEKRIAPAGSAIKLLSITVDPGHDTPQALAEYARGYGATRDRWVFATGSTEAVQNAVVAGFKLPMGPSNETERKPTDVFEILHSEKLVLIDAGGRIRGYYDSDEAGVERLLRDTAALVEGRSR